MLRASYPSDSRLRRCPTANYMLGTTPGRCIWRAAVDTKCVVLMSALDWPGHWNPYGDGHRVLRRSVPCEGCLLQVCDKEGLRCLKEISVEDVIAACCQLLVYMRHEATNKTPANNFARQCF